MNGTALDLQAAKVTLGQVSVESLASVAVQALMEGHDSPSLRQLAGLEGSDSEEARRLFEQALAELGLTLPGEREAILRLARASAIQVLRGEQSPYEGGKQIWQLTLAVDHILPELDPFIYAASEWEDRPEDRLLFDRAIVEAAKELIKNS